VEAGGELESSDLYKAQKSWFKSADGPFRGKCAYCEQIVTGSHPGDIEHYRPKSAVKKLDWTYVTRTTAGAKQQHPGYYWLRHQLSNLLFSCYDCNRPNRFNDIRFGKECRFPVEGAYAWEPGDEEQEMPQLINPCTEDPEAHLQFHGDTGLFSGKTPSGAITVDLLGLNLRNLDTQRKAAYDETIASFCYALRNLVDDLELTEQRVAALEAQDWQAFASVREKAIAEGRARCRALGVGGAE
jgi:hypothetical protein